MWGTIDLIQDHLGAILCTFLKLIYNSKMASHRVKLTGIWDSETTHTRGASSVVRYISPCLTKVTLAFKRQI